MYQSYLGYEQAVEEQACDKSLKLYQTEVFEVYLMATDSIIDTHKVVVAAVNNLAAIQQAEDYCCINVPVISGTMFSIAERPIKIES